MLQLRLRAAFEKSLVVAEDIFLCLGERIDCPTEQDRDETLEVETVFGEGILNHLKIPFVKQFLVQKRTVTFRLVSLLNFAINLPFLPVALSVILAAAVLDSEIIQSEEAQNWVQFLLLLKNFMNSSVCLVTGLIDKFLDQPG